MARVFNIVPNSKVAFNFFKNKDVWIPYYVHLHVIEPSVLDSVCNTIFQVCFKYEKVSEAFWGQRKKSYINTLHYSIVLLLE